MEQKNRIIVLVDLSEHSETLIKFADTVAPVIRAELTFVHRSAGLAPALADIESRSQIIEMEKDEALEKLKEMVANFSNASDPKFIVSEKRILALLNDLKDEAYSDLVFLGLKKNGLLKSLLMGSTTTKIVDETDLLTIAIPLETPGFIPEKLVIGASHKFPVNRKEFSRLLHQFSTPIKELEFITVVTSKDNKQKAQEYLKELKKSFDNYNCSYNLFEGENAFEAIKSYMRSTPQAYLVVQQGSRTLTDGLFRKFMIKDLVHNASIPLIILPQ